RIRRGLHRDAGGSGPRPGRGVRRQGRPPALHPVPQRRAQPCCGAGPLGAVRRRPDGMTPAELSLPAAYGELAGLRIGHPGAPRVIALHGWLDNAASFLPLLPHLPPLDLLLLDFPGHGRSAHLPPGAEYALPSYIHAVLDAADALGWDRFALLGHSMGAAVAAMAAVAVPERIERLALIETVGPLSEEADAAPARLRQAVAAARALREKRLRVF